jgi:hypothetical protein
LGVPAGLCDAKINRTCCAWDCCVGTAATAATASADAQSIFFIAVPSVLLRLCFVWLLAADANSGHAVGNRVAPHLAVCTRELGAAIAIACDALSKR